jgi:hypothetical protein
VNQPPPALLDFVDPTPPGAKNAEKNRTADR